MSNVHSRTRHLMSALALSAGITLVGSATSAPPAKGPANNLDRIGRLTAVAAQKAENDVRGAVLSAQQAKTTEKAIDILKRAAAKLEDNTSLTEARRKSLGKMLEARIAAYEAGPEKKPLGERDLEKTIRKFEDKRASEKKKEEQARLQKALVEILDLQKEGKIADARLKAKEIAREFPGNPAAAAAYTTMSSIDQLVSARTTKGEKERGVLGVLKGVDKSGIPISGDIEFSKDPEVIKRREMRKGIYGPIKLSPKEQAIVRALSSPVSVDFKGDRFQDVIEYLATVTGQPILLDRNDLKDAQIDYETPVTLAVKNVSARTVLRKILAEFGLTYMVKDETIQIVSITKARETMTIRTYPVGDLMAVGGGPGDPLTNFFGPGIGQVQRMQSLANLVSTIQSTVDPSSWQINGGPGTIAFDFTTMTLIVKNSAEVHAMIGGSIAR